MGKITAEQMTKWDEVKTAKLDETGILFYIAQQITKLDDDVIKAALQCKAEDTTLGDFFDAISGDNAEFRESFYLKLKTIAGYFSAFSVV